MQYYGVIGLSIEINYQNEPKRIPSGFIKMRGPRPTDQHIATKYPNKRLADWVMPEQVTEDEKDNAE